MSHIRFRIVTNNPLVKEKYELTHNVIFVDTDYEGILRYARDRIYEGHQLLTHPLSGSVKPNETPYKSMLIASEKGQIDQQSLKLIENAINSCAKFEKKYLKFGPEVYQDFQLIDSTLIESGIASAEM